MINQNIMSDLTVPQKEILPVTVVIASLGGINLANTIFVLNQGYGVPAEIIVSVPSELYQSVVELQLCKNVKVIRSDDRGQVAQRAIGLIIASNPYVLQMDDDVIFEMDTLKSLVEVLMEKGEKNVVAPFFKLQSNGENSTKSYYGIKGFFLNCYYWLVFGAFFGRKRYGSISPAGIGFGVLKEKGKNRQVESEWLPGGAVICHREDLIVNNYYPFPGKAYSEDLIHSVLWRKNGVRLWTDFCAIAFVDVSNESMKWIDLIARLRAYIYVAKIVDGSPWRCYLWFLFHITFNAQKISLLTK